MKLLDAVLGAICSSIDTIALNMSISDCVVERARKIWTESEAPLVPKGVMPSDRDVEEGMKKLDERNAGRWVG